MFLLSLIIYGEKATQPCPFGYLDDADRRCHCSPDQVQRYRARISGPLLDRIDLHVQVSRIPPGDLLGPKYEGETSGTVRARVSRCRERQQQGYSNAQLPPDRLTQFCALGTPQKKQLEKAATLMHLSGRGLHRTLRVARIIADLSEADKVEAPHISEALAYRGQTAQP